MQHAARSMRGVDRPIYLYIRCLVDFVTDSLNFWICLEHSEARITAVEPVFYEAYN